jgi:Uma2 family endonuclease
VVWMQNPIVLAEDSEPVPDISVLRQRPVSYKEREADAADVFVLIEVADTSLAYDRSTTARLYAEAGVPEYWVVDCTAESVEVYRMPGPEGYRDIRLVAGRATLTLQAFPDVALTTAQIFA